MVLLGHNGAGKSTLLLWLMGCYTDPSQHPFLPLFSSHFPPLERSRVGYAPEAALLDGAMSAAEYIDLMAVLRGVERVDHEALVARVGLRADLSQPVHTYSKGMRQRLLLALALVGDPALLVLDEPTSGLDPFGYEQISALIVQLAEHHEMIVATHSLDLAMRVGGEAVILREGQIGWRGVPASLEALQRAYMACAPIRGGE